MSESSQDHGERSPSADVGFQRRGDRLWSRPEVRWGAGVLALAAGIRLLFWQVYQPAFFGDTATYLRLANVIADGSLRGYDGTRTPGYPAFLGLVGRDPQLAWATQIGLLGLSITLGLYWVGWRLTLRPRLAGGGAAAGNPLSLGAGMGRYSGCMPTGASTVSLIPQEKGYVMR